MQTNNSLRLVFLALTLIFGGGALAWFIQTDGGRVDVQDVRWEGTGGTRMSGLLYVPEGATPESPAPGIVAIHGYINSRETQGGFAIELSRRGYVVLAADQTGHGYSDPPAFANGYGGPDALAYLRSLDFVDTDNVGLEGHSMGGWASAIAAGVYPEDYRSIVLVGSSTGTAGAPEGTATSPRNLAVVFSRWDEFSGMMWGSPVSVNVVNSPKLQAVFGTDQPVQVGQLYGSVADGTARRLTQPRTTHPGDHLSSEAIGDVVTWFALTLDGGSDLPAGEQRWYWKELGTLLGALGMVLLIFGVGGWLLHTPLFSGVAGTPPPSRAATGWRWGVSALVFAFLGPLTLFPFTGLFAELGWSATPLFPQNVTSQVVLFTSLVTLISLVLFALWHFTSNRGTGAGQTRATLDDYGLTVDGRLPWGRIGWSAALSIAVVAAAYAALLLTDALFTTDFRFWVFGVKLMSALHFRIFLAYLVPFFVFFLVTSVVLAGQLKRELSTGWEITLAVGLSAGGYVVFLLYQYVPLFAGGTLATPTQPLWAIIAFQFVPLMAIAGALMSYFFRRTGLVYVGALVSSLLVTWIVVASQAIHWG
jgi:pimeloyl-ACP methyl ester carboxylesterase